MLPRPGSPLLAPRTERGRAATVAEPAIGVHLFMERPMDRRWSMPVYGFRCVKCGAEFDKRMTVAQREKARPACPECKGRKVEAVVTGFFAKTSRKS